jgi:hypothetical protein
VTFSARVELEVFELIQAKPKKKKKRLFMGVALLAHLHGCEAHRTHKVWLNREEEEEDAEGE